EREHLVRDEHAGQPGHVQPETVVADHGIEAQLIAQPAEHGPLTTDGPQQAGELAGQRPELVTSPGIMHRDPRHPHMRQPGELPPQQGQRTAIGTDHRHGLALQEGADDGHAARRMAEPPIQWGHQDAPADEHGTKVVGGTRPSTDAAPGGYRPHCAFTASMYASTSSRPCPVSDEVWDMVAFFTNVFSMAV